LTTHFSSEDHGRVQSKDGELLVILERGDRPAAMAWLVRVHGEGLRAFVARRLAVWARPWGIDEVCQEVWADALLHLASYRRQGPVRAWLFGIADHKIADFFRRRRRDAPLDDAVSKLIEASTHRPSRVLARVERMRAVKAILEALEPEQRTLIVWRYGDGLKPAQILQRLVNEGLAAEVGLDSQVRALLAADGDQRRSLEKKVINLITQRIHRAVLRVIELWKEQEASRRVEDG
jgi:RNA polymerase sigma-70 factor (ECF subfamily)